MADVIFVAIIVAFFSLAALFVRACDRIIGDETESTSTTPEPADLEKAA